MNITNEREYDETRELEEQEKELYSQLKTLMSNSTSRIEGWYSDTISELLMGRTVENICIKGKWPKVSWDGKRIIIKQN